MKAISGVAAPRNRPFLHVDVLRLITVMTSCRTLSICLSSCAATDAIRKLTRPTMKTLQIDYKLNKAICVETLRVV